MKKSLIALAVLAASGAAMAQSSVTISGNVNLGVVKNTGESAKLDTVGGSSNLVFAGTEDLGGGLKATFKLSHRFQPESGGMDGSGASVTALSRPFWQPESTVGLSGNFGAVKIGRSLTALSGPRGASDPWGGWTVGNVDVLGTGYSTDPADGRDKAGGARTDAITYASPVFSGFSASASLGLKNSVSDGTATTQAKNLASLWLSYANGPIMIGGGVEQNRADDDTAVILGSYDFGIAKLMAGYSQVDVLTTAGKKGKNWNLGVSAPFGQFTFKAGYGNMKAEGDAQTETKKVGIGAEYALSKRTYLYTTFGRTKKDGAAATKGFDIGMNHAF